MLTTEHERVVDFLVRALPALCEPFDDVLGVGGINPINVIEPTLGLGSVAGYDYRRAIEVEDRYVFALDPSALRYEAVADQHWLSWCPGHLLDGLVLIEPNGGGHLFLLALFVEHGLTGATSGMGGMRALTLPAGQWSRAGA